ELPRVRLHDDDTAALRIGPLDRARDRLLGSPLNVTVDGEAHVAAGRRRPSLVARHRDALAVQPDLHDRLAVPAGERLVHAVLEPAEAVAVHPDEADDIRRQLPARVDTLALRLRADPGQVQVEDRTGLFRGHRPLQ